MQKPAKQSFLPMTHTLSLNRDFTDHHFTVARLEKVKKSWTAHYHDSFKTMSLIELN